MNRLIVTVLLGLLGSAAMASPAAATTCLGDPSNEPAAVCVNADPHVYDPYPSQPGTGVSTAESVTIFIDGSPTPLCIGRVELSVNVPAGPSGGIAGPVVWRCY